ncbi:transposable element Tc1 transposase [Trichonephila clavipes]|uniref:Transposable element Tc1 transposase n=1 Tax=Trichonephila clavipes TaxID=2585209 RepID=A0A8X6VF48_TRICX|nr:transposable element Tc1 transposase [Trichonephila clavipes]
MKTAGWSTHRVASQVDRSECAVRNCWEQRIQESAHVWKTGSGATRKTMRRDDRRIVRQVLVDPTVTRSTIRADEGLAIVSQTISRHLAEVVFGDESRFVRGTDDNCVRVWRCPGERYNSPQYVLRHTGRTAGVIVWGTIAYDSRSTLIVMRGTLTGQRYVDNILGPHVGPFLNGLPGAILQQDNARPHTARVAQDLLRHFQALPWPAQLAVQDLWAHLPQDNIRFLINSMPDRVAACIAAGGGPTRY